MDDLDKYYRILGLKPGASREKVKQAYRDLVTVWHPDRFSHNPRLQRKAEEKLTAINQAYERLEAFFREPGYQPYQSKPRRESAGGQSYKPQEPLEATSTKKTAQKLAYRVQGMLAELESMLRVTLAMVGIKLPPLTTEGRFKAALFLVAAIYLLVFTVYLLVTL
jgi:curved DNA-binding protein CbpA